MKQIFLLLKLDEDLLNYYKLLSKSNFSIFQLEVKFLR